MNVLLDTSVVLYLLKYPEKISPSALKEIENSDGFYVSLVSLWEIAIKTKIGKLKVVLPLESIPELIGAQIMPVKIAHADCYLDVELPHKDPFDTMLIAQCKAENMQLVTSDKLLINSKYPTINSLQ